MWNELRGVTLRDGESRVAIKVVGYADDLAIVASSKSMLQQNLDVLARALASIGCALSVEKTKIMVVEAGIRVTENTPTTYAARIEKIKAKLGEEAQHAEEAEIRTEGKREVIRWQGETKKCPKCDYITADGRAMQQHLRRKHDVRCAVVAAGRNAFANDAFAEDVDGRRCKWCNHVFSCPRNAPLPVNT